ncbi:uncharacterized protein F4822DRAFT_374721 [Hypoxylon trugodes]|uniref:uncharacterized protein n=1 Tax=Hypoxylon trugodes TaxID=326681 RepID=UPI002198123E|nr:uncharacterized protein F4822DRAFT_374721 [Hypoxylon trugodes]KAI1384846.1 hypothetical protein F4822DRAFT_374721 [Hypoxylon trugodes]
MVNSRGIPSHYTAQWKAGPITRTSSDNRIITRPQRSDNNQLRYCSSCNKCRKSRVRCTGGSPCQRCAESLDPSLCVYSVSQRHGRRKASARGLEGFAQHVNPQQVLQSSASSSDPSLQDGQSDGGNDTFQAVLDGPWSLVAADTEVLAPVSVLEASPQFNSSTPQPTEALDILALQEPLASPFQLNLGADLAHHNYSCNCSFSNQTYIDRMLSAINEPQGIGLDEILQIFQDISTHSANYFNCTQCDECPRLINISMLHQRQVRLLCTIAKNPTTYLQHPNGKAVRLTFGSFQLSERDDLDHKRLLILTAARNVDSLVSSFNDNISRHQSKTAQSSSGTTEAAELTFKWLSDIARNLKSRLKVIASIVKEPDWVLAAG